MYKVGLALQLQWLLFCASVDAVQMAVSWRLDVVRKKQASDKYIV